MFNNENNKEGYTYDYPRPAVTVDTVLFAVLDGALKVLLVRRKADPFKDMWALPGGFVEMDEDLRTAALRELSEETGVDAGEEMEVQQLHTYGDPDRDPRGRMISVAYIALASRDVVNGMDIQGADDAAEACWWIAYDLPEMAFDHKRILADALQQIRKMNDPLPPKALLPKHFTVAELQVIYEALSNTTVDAHTFQEKALHSEIVASVSPSMGKNSQQNLLYFFIHKK